MLKEIGNTEVNESRTEKYRRKLSFVNKVNIKFISGTVNKLNFISKDFKVCITYNAFELMSENAVFTKLNNLFFSVKTYIIFLAIIYTFKKLATADRPCYGNGRQTECVLQIFKKLKRILCLTVELVYECKYWNTSHTAYLKELLCLCLDTLCGVDNHYGTVNRGKYTVGIFTEVIMSRCIHNRYYLAVIFKLHYR